MTLEEWDNTTGKNLRFIEAGAEMAARHAKMMAVRPAFDTKAEDELAITRKVLETALANIKGAQETMKSKPVETSHAA